MSALSVEERTAQRTVRVGDVYRGFRKSHYGWQIKITKVAQSSVEYQLVKSHGAVQREGRGTKTYRLPHEGLLRDFLLVRPGNEERPRVSEVITTPNETPETPETQTDWRGEQLPAPPRTEIDERFRVCKNCGMLKPIEAFDILAGKYYQQNLAEGKRVAVCHPCLVEKRNVGIRQGHAKRVKERAEAERAERLRAVEALERSLPPEELETTPTDVEAPPEPKPPTPPPVPTPEQSVTFRVLREAPAHSSLSGALLELAAEAEKLERPPAYRALVTALDAAARVGTDAGPVFVVPSEQWLAVAVALEEALADVASPATNGTA